MNRIVTAVLAVGLLLFCGGCSALRTITGAAFSRASVTDLMIEGVKGEVVSLDADLAAAGLDPTTVATLGDILSLGALLPVFQLGESVPTWVLCTGEFAAQAEKVPRNGKVRIWGKPLPSGVVIPSRISSPDAED